MMSRFLFYFFSFFCFFCFFFLPRVGATSGMGLRVRRAGAISVIGRARPFGLRPGATSVIAPPVRRLGFLPGATSVTGRAPGFGRRAGAISVMGLGLGLGF